MKTSIRIPKTHKHEITKNIKNFQNVVRQHLRVTCNENKLGTDIGSLADLLSGDETNTYVRMHVDTFTFCCYRGVANIAMRQQLNNNW